MSDPSAQAVPSPASQDPDADDRRLGWWVGACALGLLVAFAWPAFQGAVYTETDLRNFHIPMRHFFAEALARGGSALWFPGEFLGFHLHGEGQAVLMHPLNRLAYRWLPFHAAFNFEMFRSYVIGFAGLAVLLRRFRLPVHAALFGALLFTFCSFQMLRFMHVNLIGTVAMLPWALVSIHAAVVGATPRSRGLGCVGLALSTGLMLLHAHPHIMWLCLLVEAAFAFFVAGRAHALRRLALPGFAQIVGLAIGAVQVLPQWESLGLSVRAVARHDPAFALPFAPIELVQIFSPYVFRHRVVGAAQATELSAYLGAAVPVLATWVVVRWPQIERGRELAAFGGGLVVAGLWLSLGDSAGLNALLSSLPVVGLFRGAARALVLAQLGAAIVAAVGFADLALRCRAMRRAELRGRFGAIGREWWLLAPLVVSGIVVRWAYAVEVGLFPFASAAEVVPRGAWLGFGAIAAATAVVVLASRGHAWALALLVLVATVDHGVYGLSAVRREPSRRLTERLATQPLPPWAHVYRMPLGEPALTMEGARLVSGYAAMTPRRRLDFGLDGGPPRRPDVHRAVLRLVGAGIAFGRGIPDPMPRSWLVAELAPDDRLNERIARIDPRRVALVEDPDLLGARPAEPFSGHVEVERDLPGEIEIQTNASCEAFLVVSESWHPGWQIRIDHTSDAPAALVRAYGDLMGAVVPAGRHTVELTFKPASVRWGLVASVGGLLALGPLYWGCSRLDPRGGGADRERRI